MKPYRASQDPLPRVFTQLALGLLAAAAVVSVAAAVPHRPLLAYWAFNCFTTCGDANLAPEAVSQSPASMTSSFEPDAGVNESGTTLNVVPLHEARAALTLRSGTGGLNNGRALTWRVDTSGQTALQVSFATRRSASGFRSNQFQYSVDGATFVDFGLPFDPPLDFAVVAYDLRRIRGLNDNPNAAFRIVWNGGSRSAADEYALIDNLQVVGK